MLISRSFWRKVVATLGAAVGLVFVYETTIRDSRNAAPQAVLAETVHIPQPGSRLQFTATAYCKGETTASGVGVRTGIAAADPALLPVGTVVRIDTPDESLDGVWTIMDTGPAVQGRTIDLYLWSCHDALRFGRRSIQLEVLRLGWHPRNSQPGRIGSLFKRREVERLEKAKTREATPLEATPIPASDAVPAAAPVPPPETGSEGADHSPAPGSVPST
jgi:3D (Asp-Asp-Asp) domain-containing protein